MATIHRFHEYRLPGRRIGWYGYASFEWTEHRSCSLYARAGGGYYFYSRSECVDYCDFEDTTVDYHELPVRSGDDLWSACLECGWQHESYLIYQNVLGFDEKLAAEFFPHVHIDESQIICPECGEFLEEVIVPIVYGEPPEDEPYRKPHFGGVAMQEETYHCVTCGHDFVPPGMPTALESAARGKE